MFDAPLAPAGLWTKLASKFSSPTLSGSVIRAVGLATQLLVLILMGRLLPKSVFGDAILVFTGYRLLSYAIGSGAGSLLVYHVARTAGDATLDLHLSRRLTLATSVLAGTASLGCALLAPSIAALFGKPGMTAWLTHMSPLVLFGALLQVTSNSLDARNRVTQSILLTELTPNMLRMLGMGCVALCGLPQLAVAWVFWLAVAAPWMFDSLRLFARYPSRGMEELGWADARYAFWLGIYPLLGMQLQGIDMLIVGMLFSSSAVAEYSIASRLATLFPFLQQMVVRVFTPRSGPLFQQNDTRTINSELYGLRRMSLASTAGMAAIILLAAPVVMHLMGDYNAGLGVLAALAIPPLVRSNFAGIEVVLRMRAQGRALAGAAAATLLVIVAGSWLLHQFMGLYALPASMLVSAISINSLMAWRIRRNGIDVTSWRLVPLIVGACVALVLAICWLPPVTTSLAGGVLMANVAWLAYRNRAGKLGATRQVQDADTRNSMSFSPFRIKNALVAGARHVLWRSAARKLSKAPTRTVAPLQSALIVASDPGEVVGSRGDDAMFTVVVKALRERNPQCRIGVVCVSAPLPELLANEGVVAEPIWNGHGYAGFINLLERYDTLVMIGADVMDGHYSGSNALRQWAFSDLAARRGLRAFVLGCSFSNHISAPVARALPLLSPKLRVFARERQSKHKFDGLATTAATLVADSAFLLSPSPTGPDHAAVREWADAQRAQGRFVCALNVHPMIFRSNDMNRVVELNQALAGVLSRLVQRHPVSILLAPHDFREGNLGDNAALSPLHELLKPVFGEHVLHATLPARASEIKAMVAAADMLVTGRMHLGVGALSVGVPMWGLSPQDKFIGLFEHFGLPDQRITPDQARDVAALEAFIEDAFTRREQVREQVRAALPAVKELAAINFIHLDA